MSQKNGGYKQKETNVSLSFPDEIMIELVQANELRHYELFQWLIALFSPVAVGFWTAYFIGGENSLLFWSAIIFSAASFFFLFLAWRYRKKLFHGSIKKMTKISNFR